MENLLKAFAFIRSEMPDMALAQRRADQRLIEPCGITNQAKVLSAYEVWAKKIKLVNMHMKGKT